MNFDWVYSPSLSAASLPAGLPAHVRSVFPLGLHSTAAGPGGTGKLLEYQPIARDGALRPNESRETMSVTQEQVHGALKEVLDPNTGRIFLRPSRRETFKVEGGNVSLEIELGYPAKPSSIRSETHRGKAPRVPGVTP